MEHLQVTGCRACPSTTNCDDSGFRPIAEAFRQIRDYIEAVGPGPGAVCLSNEAPSDFLLRKAAANLAAARKQRARFIPAEFLGEPSWDIMLELFAQATPLSVKSVSIGSGVPLTTTLRWIGLLEQQGLVRQFGDPTDARRTLVALTREGEAAAAASVNSIREAVSDLAERA
ncbi:MAG TPA: hypothetical protein VFP14_03205 [Novosphingobium sp.]|nr:hypothetical protein [Novosphingobium sp.]